jgi:class 3 adenylate cyclase
MGTAARGGTESPVGAINATFDSITAHGGRVDHTEGDAFVAVFTDAKAEVRATAEAQRRVSAYQWPEGAGTVKVRPS